MLQSLLKDAVFNLTSPLIREEIKKVRKTYRDAAKAGDIANGTVSVMELAYSKIEPFWGTLKPHKVTIIPRLEGV